MPQRILVIKLGAFGDMIQALDAMAAIRAHHAADELVLMTTPAYAPLAAAAPWFDRLWIDRRAPWWRPDVDLARRRRFLTEGFSRVYDLQCSPRTARYRMFIPAARRPEWVGAAGPAHASNRAKIAAQLASVGIGEPCAADLGWLDAPVGRLGLPERYALLIPGGGPTKPRKRWGAARYGELARRLGALGLPSVVVGGPADRAVIDAVRETAPEAIDLCGRTSHLELAGVARRAALAVGNDTGATFLASALGAPTLMLMSRDTDPVVSAPWGPGAAWVRRDALSELMVEDVQAALPPVREPAARL
jgi:ADP-heptose:LPS heptosyltransferase